ncbi:MAG: hypothetical protein DMG95_06555 [Acidobacteria bacterium]|nr:MAG: hypothetical protein DMG95_06555 [Acidobacteriota bacterium]
MVRCLYNHISASRNIGRATSNVSAAQSDNPASGARVCSAGKEKLFIMRSLPHSKMSDPHVETRLIAAD